MRNLAKELTASKPVNSMINPEEVVAIGAAIQAAMIAGEVLRDCKDTVCTFVRIILRFFGTFYGFIIVVFFVSSN